jgi:hypothetical protein
MILHIHGVGRWLETAFGLPVSDGSGEDGEGRTGELAEVVAGVE